jgi:hypothetical protein
MGGRALDLGGGLGGPFDQSVALVCGARGHFLKMGWPRRGDVVAAGNKPAGNLEWGELEGRPVKNKPAA